MKLMGAGHHNAIEEPLPEQAISVLKYVVTKKFRSGE
jgi:hypothetical protein